MSVIEAVWKPDEVEKKEEAVEAAAPVAATEIVEAAAPAAAAETETKTEAPAAEVVADPAPVAAEKVVVETVVEPVANGNGVAEEAKAVEAK